MLCRVAQFSLPRTLALSRLPPYSSSLTLSHSLSLTLSLSSSLIRVLGLICFTHCSLSREHSSGSADGRDRTRTESSSLSYGGLEVTRVLEMPYELSDHESFRPIPDKRWPSDHLALGATLLFT